LWILKDSQLKKAILSAKKLSLEEEISGELKRKITFLEENNKVKDSLVVDLKKDRDYYINNWKTCTSDVDLLLKKNHRQNSDPLVFFRDNSGIYWRIFSRKLN